jgi:hypothetical protein
VKVSSQHVEVNLSDLKGYEKQVIVELIKETHNNHNKRIISNNPINPKSRLDDCRGIYLFLFLWYIQLKTKIPTGFSWKNKKNDNIYLQQLFCTRQTCYLQMPSSILSGCWRGIKDSVNFSSAATMSQGFNQLDHFALLSSFCHLQKERWLYVSTGILITIYTG